MRFPRISKQRLFFLLFICCIQASFAYHLVITGTARGLNSRQLTLSCPAWVEAEISMLDEQNRFAFVVDYPYPAMFELQYGFGTAALKTELFVFEDLTVEATLVSDNGNDQIFLRIPNYRSTAFKAAKNYTNDLFASKSAHETDKIIARIKNIPYIDKQDSYTDVFARSEMLNFADVLARDYGVKYEVGAFSRPQFDSLPINDERYYGFPAYKDLMTSFYKQNILVSISKAGKSAFDFQTLMHFTDSLSRNLPEALKFDLFVGVLSKFRYQDLPTSQQALYATYLNKLIVQYPKHPAIGDLELKMVDVFNSLVNREAPAFALKDLNGKLVKSADFKDKFLLIDVWGSWCRPCRAKSPELRELHQIITDYQMEVELVGIANEQDSDAWKEAIIADRLVWRQLRADAAFLESYGIKEYPTMILINRAGKVLKMGPNISLNDLIELMY